MLIKEVGMLTDSGVANVGLAGFQNEHAHRRIFSEASGYGETCSLGGTEWICDHGRRRRAGCSHQRLEVERLATLTGRRGDGSGRTAYDVVENLVLDVRNLRSHGELCGHAKQCELGGKVMIDLEACASGRCIYAESPNAGASAVTRRRTTFEER